MKNLSEDHKTSGGNVEPYMTLRGHTAPLLSITNPSQTTNPAYSRLIFTAGVEGSIRLWNLPTVKEVNQYGDTFEGKNYCIGVWSDSTNSTNQEAFWDIKYHPFSDYLLSVSANKSVLVWDCANLNLESSENPGKVLNRFGFSGTSG